MIVHIMVMYTGNGDDGELCSPAKQWEEVILYRTQNGLICREFPVKETHRVIRTVDDNGNKMVNEYVREYKIGSGGYRKVVLLFPSSHLALHHVVLQMQHVLYRSRFDGKHYAIKAFHKSHLLKLLVAPPETTMTDVLREVLIMKMVEHPNIVNLIEVIDDPTTVHFCVVLEYVEGKWVCEGSGPPGGLGENSAWKYLRDVVFGLMYLHAHNIVHRDIKPDNLLVTGSGTVKIGDFSVSQVFEIVNNELLLPDTMNPLLKNLIQGLFCKDPKQQMSLTNVAEHAWLVGAEGLSLSIHVVASVTKCGGMDLM